MSALKTIRMTLTGPFKGKTKLFGKYQFVNGICDFSGNDVQVASVTKYFVTSYQVKVKDVVANEVEIEEVEVDENEVEVDENEALRVDDSDVLTDEQIDEQDEQKSDPEEPNPRQADIIAAVNGIEKTEWVDQNAKTPRPRVKDVSVLMEDPTVTVAEIVEVIEKWLS